MNSSQHSYGNENRFLKHSLASQTKNVVILANLMFICCSKRIWIYHRYWLMSDSLICMSWGITNDTILLYVSNRTEHFVTVSGAWTFKADAECIWRYDNMKDNSTLLTKLNLCSQPFLSFLTTLQPYLSYGMINMAKRVFRVTWWHAQL